ncbi:aldo/keto reductase [Streptomyces sp. NPDC019890]|uniref:aldo/keto reductase n=1 Tax=Streptomyces sp. NPDC019890 TaxID=3365064 RepID=UPI00384EA64B
MFRPPWTSAQVLRTFDHGLPAGRPPVAWQAAVRTAAAPSTTRARIIGRRNMQVARVALAWVLARPGITSVIVGAKRPDQLTENLAAVDLVLTDEDLADLDAAGALPVPYPDWGQGAPADRLPLHS